MDLLFSDPPVVLDQNPSSNHDSNKVLSDLVHANLWPQLLTGVLLTLTSYYGLLVSSTHQAHPENPV